MINWRQADLQSDSYTISIDSFKVDLMNGRIMIHTNGEAVAEHITLAFAISLLHVLCVPRNSLLEGTSAYIKPVLSSGLRLVVAAGLDTNAPTNEYIKSHFEKKKLKLDEDKLEDIVTDVADIGLTLAGHNVAGNDDSEANDNCIGDKDDHNEISNDSSIWDGVDISIERGYDDSFGCATESGGFSAGCGVSGGTSGGGCGSSCGAGGGGGCGSSCGGGGGCGSSCGGGGGCGSSCGGGGGGGSSCGGGGGDD